MKCEVAFISIISLALTSFCGEHSDSAVETGIKNGALALDTAGFNRYYAQNALCPQVNPYSWTTYYFMRGDTKYALYSLDRASSLGDLLSSSPDARKQWGQFKRRAAIGWICSGIGLAIVIADAAFVFSQLAKPLDSGHFSPSAVYVPDLIGCGFCIVGSKFLTDANNSVLRAVWYYNRDVIGSYHR